jgi:hypothetical protein
MGSIPIVTSELKRIAVNFRQGAFAFPRWDVPVASDLQTVSHS